MRFRFRSATTSVTRADVDAYRPERSATSFVQCRPMHSRAHTDECLDRLKSIGFEELPLDDFYDVLAEERKLIRRLRLPVGQLELTVPGVLEIRVAAALHVMFWSVGFAVFRVSLATNDLNPEPGEGLNIGQLSKLHALEHELGEGVDARWTFDLPGAGVHCPSGNIRRLFDYFGFLVHEYGMGHAAPSASTLSTWSQSFASGQERARRLVRFRELKYVYPVTFGSHSEYVWVGEVPERAHHWAPIVMGEGETGDGAAQEIESKDKDAYWFLEEFQSVVMISTPRTTSLSRLGSWSDSRLALVEYIALRRGVLRTIQRATNQATAERTPLLRSQVADWLWLTSAVTDDYVLAGWQAARFERIKRTYGQSRSLRSITELEAQVRRNIDSFQGRLDAESDRVGVAAAILFGIVAATALVPEMQAVALVVFGLTGQFGEFPAVSPFAYLAIVAGLLMSMAGVGWYLMRRVGRLRPPQIEPSRLASRWARRGGG